MTWADIQRDERAFDRTPLEACTGDTDECPHYECPDGWHSEADLPCSCTPDCAIDDEPDPERVERVAIMRLAMENNPDLAFTAADMEDI